jgi:uncharacterized RDD family membrane protein YckC
VEIEDRHVTSTPEGISLDFVLAGLGSRLAAFAVDFLIQSAVELIFVFALGFTAAAFSASSPTTSTLLFTGATALVVFLVNFGYFVLFETLDGGRSPGKRLVGIRVVRVGGGPVGFLASFLRNVVRLVDSFPPPFYGVGMVAVLASKRNQRLGDMLAGTLVVRTRVGALATAGNVAWTDPAQWGQPGSGPVVPGGWAPPPPTWLPPELAHWDVTSVGPRELALVQAFLTNRWGYTPHARDALGRDLAGRLWPRVAGPTGPMPAETFLEAVALVKSVRG